jgi:hypothetical protein
MQTSEKIIEISKALATLQAGLQPVEKDGTNPHFKNRYATLDGIIESIRPQMKAAGLVFIQCPEGTPGGVAITTRIMHTSGEWIESTVVMPVAQQTAQAAGSAITYGRRYALAAMLGISADDDDGQQASEKAPVKSAPVKQAEPTEPAHQAEGRKAISEIQKAGNITDADVKAQVQIILKRPGKYSELTEEQVMRLVNDMKVLDAAIKDRKEGKK